jgi:hypothetical protein
MAKENVRYVKISPPPSLVVFKDKYPPRDEQLYPAMIYPPASRLFVCDLGNKTEIFLNLLNK